MINSYDFVKRLSITLITLLCTISILTYFSPKCSAIIPLSNKGAWNIIQNIPYDYKNYELKFMGNAEIMDGVQGQDYFVFNPKDSSGIYFRCLNDGTVAIITVMIPHNEALGYAIPYFIFASALGFHSDYSQEIAETIYKAMAGETSLTFFVPETRHTYLFYGKRSQDGKMTNLTMMVTR